MGRKAATSNDDLIAQIGKVFRETGYEGASLSMLSAATGLQKASLYHRFPGGKEQMATEVLLAAGTWLSENVLKPLQEPGDPAAKIQGMLKRLDEFYSGGRQACLLNMLSATRIQGGPFTKLIQQTFKVWIETLSDVLVEAGIDKPAARRRAERAVVMLQGSLVLARGMGSEQPFRHYLKTARADLLGEQPE
ncbi:MAG TPA: TetR/AcrR family transcriptional regulator [Solibacterales bacterium]|nr:TetR/AcrR family transcriptional regulator [Bryobacterales bacterium]